MVIACAAGDLGLARPVHSNTSHYRGAPIPHAVSTQLSLCPNPQRMRALEFYSGIGGMHYGLKLARADVEVAAAFDIDDMANNVYESNFGLRPHQCNVQALARSRLEKLAADLWMMAPPCQPYTRRGLKRGHGDTRAGSFLSLLSHLQQMCRPPDYLLLENVVGFEVSETHAEMLRILESCGYVSQEFVLSPVQFGIPYSRPRYFCLARRCQAVSSLLPFELQRNPVGQPYCQPPSHLLSSQSSISPLHLPGEEQSAISRSTLPLNQDQPCPASSISVQPISAFLQESQPASTSTDGLLAEYAVPGDLLDKAGVAIDIVTADALICNCFTSTYGRYIKGSGSVLATTNLDTLAYLMVPARETTATTGQHRWRRIAVPSGLATGDGQGEMLEPSSEGHGALDCLQTSQQTAGVYEPAQQQLAALTNSQIKPWLTNLGLRFFTPKEIANLHSFPASFTFPSAVQARKQYALVGNSVSAAVVAGLLQYLLSDSDGRCRQQS